MLVLLLAACALPLLSLGCRMAPPSTPLALAAWTGDTARIRQLLDAGVSPEEPDQRGLTPLQLAAREDWVIFSMVRLADIIKVRPKTRKSLLWNNRIQGKHIDFVVCDYETLEVKLAIELEDDLVPRSQRRARDTFVTVALTAAGVPLLRVKVREKYETAAVRKDIEDALGIVRKKKRA